jgi:hypothetical protein
MKKNEKIKTLKTKETETNEETKEFKSPSKSKHNNTNKGSKLKGKKTHAINHNPFIGRI